MEEGLFLSFGIILIRIGCHPRQFSRSKPGAPKDTNEKYPTSNSNPGNSMGLNNAHMGNINTSTGDNVMTTMHTQLKIDSQERFVSRITELIDGSGYRSLKATRSQRKWWAKLRSKAINKIGDMKGWK